MPDDSVTNKTKKLRSQHWFGGATRDGFIHRSWMKNQGLPDDTFDGRPVIGICNTFSELTPCNAHFRTIAEQVKKGVLDAGGTPFEFPVMSLGETNLRPTSMLFRNLASMDVEESIRANPMDGVILLVGCDKTTPALLMGASSCDLPTLCVSGGPMLNGHYRNQLIGSGTAVWQFSEEVRGGRMSLAEFQEAEGAMSRSPGHCMTMGTASTMASMVESLGVGLPHNAAIPAVDSRRNLLARLAGRRIVEMVREDLKLSKILTKQAFENAIRVNGAIGGSTNAVIHLTAIAGRAGVSISLARFNELSDSTPLLVDLKPIGNGYMEDFFAAGGMGALLRELAPLLHLDCMTVTGETLGERLAGDGDHWIDRSIIAPRTQPLEPSGGVIALFGNLAPKGAIFKRSAADTKLFEHEGRAVVFSSLEDLAARIDDPALDVAPQDILVLQNAGPHSPSAMPEAGYLPIPKKLAKSGVKDMIRVSDARMSGTAFGAIVLHVTPDCASGGPLGLVRNGDRIRLSVSGRRIDLLVDDAELERRASAAMPATEAPARGYAKLYAREILGADEGCDFAFLKPPPE
jgi:L-arabonate dehydrase